MHILMIAPPKFRQEFKESLSESEPGTEREAQPVRIDWSHDFEDALLRLGELDVDSVVLDARSDSPESSEKLGHLLCELSVTTRVLAIVDNLPDGDLFAASGVVYLTPPVHLSDIAWFIRSHGVDNDAEGVQQTA